MVKILSCFTGLYFGLGIFLLGQGDFSNALFLILMAGNLQILSAIFLQKAEVKADGFRNKR